MFTGLVQHVASVEEVGVHGPKMMLRLDLGPLAKEVSIGDSVLVSGVCLTATAVRGEIVSFDVVRESLSRSTLSGLKAGSNVNVELALRLNDRLGGHLVSGHVDGVGRIRSLRKTPGEWRLVVEAPSRVLGLLAEKGSVTVDGVNLTVAALKGRTFEVALIPHTVAATTLHGARVGDRVNLEGDMIGRWVARFLGAPSRRRRDPEERLEGDGFFE